ncbi:BrnT family toxin [Sphingomonas radiodurans]|uniref:BrnT family toxin n=1 Tax=Sphingomonas radiodurans TaxID=2890321 RepID=UPI001E2BE1E5|nr:BrnT family toxin [Sphingomonas radiodurans]WBH16110.1 BrnT family toxin [Sphingomonas radiodurans]
MFEFDPAKSEANKLKHGIDFIEAQALWDDVDLTDLGMVEYDGETRHIFVGQWQRRRWTAIVTYRGGDIRIISVRRSRSSEEMAYERRRIRPDVR